MIPYLNNIPQYLSHWARSTPDAEALFVVGTHSRSFTYNRLADLVANQAFQLSTLGVGKGDRVAVLVNLDERLVINLLATASIGAVALPISVDSLPCRDVLRHYAQIKPLRAVARSGRFRRLLCEALADQPPLPALDLDASLSAADAARRSEWEELVGRRTGNEPFYVNHTSGSTSTPKLIEPTDAQLLANAHACLKAFGSGSDLRLLCTFVYHQHEHFLRPLVAGGCAVLLPYHQGESELTAECTAGRITHLMTNPPKAEAFAAEPGLEKLRGQLRVVEVGGGLLRDGLARCIAAATGAAVISAYGSTETAGVALASTPAPFTEENGLSPLPGYEAMVVDDNGKPVPSGSSGELVLKGPAVASSYLTTPPGDVRLEGGQFLTRDLAMRNSNGRIKILGRMDSAIKLLGSRQPLEPIEQALAEGFGLHARVVQCLDVEPNDYLGRRLGTALIALVLLQDGAAGHDTDWQRRLAHCALRHARLAAYLTSPRHFLFVGPDEVRLEGGKLQRKHARERFPLVLADWRPEDRARLLPAPIFWSDRWRALRRLQVESRALRHPIRVVWRELIRVVWQFFRGKELRDGHG